MTNLSTLLSNSYVGAQGTQGTQGISGASLLAWSRIDANHLAVNNSRLIADTTAGLHSYIARYTNYWNLRANN